MDLQEFFSLHPKTAVAFSGGVDSAYLLYAAKQYSKSVQAYFVKSEFQPRFEQEDAVRLAKYLKVNLKMLNRSVLTDPRIPKNLPDRCYHCKKGIFETIAKAARKDGFFVLLDGTNASDDAKERPGMRALAELSVFSPLRECGLTKQRIRRLSKEAGLFTWDKPAYACLATRIAAGEEITQKKLDATEQAEDSLRSFGFTDFRIRMQDGHARLQLLESQWELLYKRRKEIFELLKPYYQTVSLDLEVRE